MTSLFRRATEADLPAPLAMQAEGWTGDYVGYMPDGFGPIGHALFGNPESIRKNITHDRHYIVAEREGEVVGVICADPINATEAELWWIHVARRARRLGLGQQLVAHLLGELSPEIETLYVTTFDGYTPTIAFYERLGFVPHQRYTSQIGGMAVPEIKLRYAIR